MSQKKIALFIDADNISSKFGKQIIDTLESRGEIFIRRIYGNWEKLSLHGWNDCILNFSLRAVQQPDFVSGKNATDMSLAIDAMDVLYGGKAEIFALISNDSDFTPLVIRLREGGINVIGMGNENASSAFRNACNEFIDLEVSKKIQAVVKPKVVSIDERKLQQLHNLLRETAKAHDDFNGFTNLSHAGNAIAQKNFSVKNFGHSSLKDFVSAFPNLYELHKTKKNLYYRCRTKTTKAPDILRKIHGVLHETASAQGDEKGFVDLTSAGQSLHEKNLSIKGLGHSTLSKFVSAFPKLYEVKKVGKNFAYRCKD
ncbi:MAG: NYN domain-containing protein [Selenomonadaceae bacterium]|nr:NYN domain-containing protein [Selenomonadaceae bacterium]